MISHYSGKLNIWSVGQTAIAAHKFRDYRLNPTSDGIDQLQTLWAEAGMGRVVGDERDLTWAKAAFRDATAKYGTNYEAYIA